MFLEMRASESGIREQDWCAKREAVGTKTACQSISQNDQPASELHRPV